MFNWTTATWHHQKKIATWHHQKKWTLTFNKKLHSFDVSVSKTFIRLKTWVLRYTEPLNWCSSAVFYFALWDREQFINNITFNTHFNWLAGASDRRTHIINPLTTNVLHHIEISQLICNANQLTGFYMMWNIGR